MVLNRKCHVEYLSQWLSLKACLFLVHVCLICLVAAVLIHSKAGVNSWFEVGLFIVTYQRFGYFYLVDDLL